MSDKLHAFTLLPLAMRVRAYTRIHARTCPRAHAHAHTRAHTPRAYAPPCVTRASAHAPRVRPAHTRPHALPRPCAPVCAHVRRACACADAHTPANAPVSLSEPLHAVFHPSPVCLPSQPVKRLTEPYRRLYSRFPVFRVQCSTLHSVDPTTLCKMPNREKMQKTA